MNCEEWWKVLGIQRLEEKKIKIKASLPQVTPHLPLVLKDVLTGRAEFHRNVCCHVTNEV